MEFCIRIHMHTQPSQKQAAPWSVRNSSPIHGCNDVTEAISPRNDPQPHNVMDWLILKLFKVDHPAQLLTGAPLRCSVALNYPSFFLSCFLYFSFLFGCLINVRVNVQGARVDVFKSGGWSCMLRDGVWGKWEYQEPVGMLVNVSSLQKAVLEANDVEISSRFNFEAGNSVFQKTSWGQTRVWPTGRPRPTSEMRC